MTTALVSAPRRGFLARKANSIGLRSIGRTAVDCLILELETWPKPGLVSHIDAGSHVDMDAGTFRASARAIAPYLEAMAEAGASGGSMSQLRLIGMEAETAMLTATGGVNTHRGAIFGLGLLCAAAGARASGKADPMSSLGSIVSTAWGKDIVDGPVLLHSHGSRARLRFGAGGARKEAAAGVPTIYEVGLPVLRKVGGKMAHCAHAARVQACFALIARLEDTNLLHRGGLVGLQYAQRAARGFLSHGGVLATGWKAHALVVHQNFISRRLSPGGSADLLAFSLFVNSQDG